MKNHQEGQLLGGPETDVSTGAFTQQINFLKFGWIDLFFYGYIASKQFTFLSFFVFHFPLKKKTPRFLM